MKTFEDFIDPLSVKELRPSDSLQNGLIVSDIKSTILIIWDMKSIYVLILKPPLRARLAARHTLESRLR